jgi:hypothetical protein
MASGIRPFEEQDIPGCASLHQRTFRITAAPGVDLSAAYACYFRKVFLDNPDRVSGVHPLVCEENGAITGFLGATPRPMRFRGRPILAALTSQFIADPASRGLAGVRLLKTCLAGKQELTIADEANDVARRLWERLGGRTSFAHSVHWTAVLRPTQRLTEVINAPTVVNMIAVPMARLFDAGLARVPKSPWSWTAPATLAERPLEPRDMVGFWHDCNAALIPDHTEASLRRTLDRIGQLKDLHGEFKAVTLWAKDNELAGAYAYHAQPSGMSSVVLFAAQPAWEGPVLDHLLASAAAAGLSSLSGRVPPRHVHAFSRARCSLNGRPKWTLVHSPSEAILNAAMSGDDALSAIDGEWLTHFNFRHADG